MTHSTSTLGTPATLTEKELFAEFAKSEIAVPGTIGITTPVADLFRASGETAALTDAMEGAFIDLQNDRDPTIELENLLNVAHGMVHDLSTALTEWQRFKAKRLIETGRNELEHNKRYRGTHLPAGESA